MQIFYAVFVICTTLLIGYLIVERLTREPEKPKTAKFGKKLSKHLNAKKTKNDKA
jgi:hypothetical protein